LQRHKYLVHSN